MKMVLINTTSRTMTTPPIGTMGDGMLVVGQEPSRGLWLPLMGPMKWTISF